MDEPLRIVAMLPARLASSRLPGKPLLAVRGLPMIEHVRRRALSCGAFADVIVATCDREIADVVRGYGGTVAMTSPEHPAATDRVAEAARDVPCTHIVNIQGDELLVLPEDLRVFARAIASAPGIPAWNALARIEEAAELSDPVAVKCAVSASGRILFCSRDFSQASPAPEGGFEPIRRVLGILGYRRDFLERYGRMERTPLERAERIDQSRIIEHDVTLQGVEFSKGYPGINEPRDVGLVEQILERDPIQQAVLQEVLSGWPVRLSV